MIATSLLTDWVIEDFLQVTERVVLLNHHWLVVRIVAHLSVVLAVKNADLVFDFVELAFKVVHQLVHRGHNVLAHDGAVEAEEDARVRLQLEQHLAVAGSPVVLVLLELVVAALSAVFRIGPEKDGATQVD